MNVYRVLFDGIHEIVEAHSFGEAIAAWRANLIRQYKTDDCYEPEADDVKEPDSVELISEEPVIRAT